MTSHVFKNQQNALIRIQ